jgi:hypothetical protein
MLLVGLKESDDIDFEDAMYKRMHKGKDFVWDKEPVVSEVNFCWVHNSQLL